MHALGADEREPDEKTPILSDNDIIVTGLTFCLNRDGEIQSRTRGLWEWLYWSFVFFFRPNALSDRYRTFWSEIQPAEEQPARTLDFTEVASTYTSKQIKTLLQSMPEDNQRLKLTVPHYDGPTYACLETEASTIQTALYDKIKTKPSPRDQPVITFKTTDDGPVYAYINRDLRFLSWRKKAIYRQMVESAGFTWHYSLQKGMQQCADTGGLNVFQNGTNIYIAPDESKERREDDMEAQVQVLLALGVSVMIGGIFAARFRGGGNHTRPKLRTKAGKDEDESKGKTPPLRADQLTSQAAGEDSDSSVRPLRADQLTPEASAHGAHGMDGTGVMGWLSRLPLFRSTTPATPQNITSEALRAARITAMHQWNDVSLKLMRDPNYIKKNDIINLLSRLINATCQYTMYSYCRNDNSWFFHKNISLDAKKQLVKFPIYFYSNEYDRKNGKTLNKEQNIQNWTFFYHVMAQVKPHPSITSEQMLSTAFHTYLPIEDLSTKRNRPYILGAHPDKASQYKYIFDALKLVKEQFGYETELKDFQTALLKIATEDTQATKDHCVAHGDKFVLDTPSDTHLDRGFRIFLSPAQSLGDTWYRDWVKHVGDDEDSRKLWDKVIENAIEQATSIHTPSAATTELDERVGGGAGMATDPMRIGF